MFLPGEVVGYLTHQAKVYLADVHDHVESANNTSPCYYFTNCVLQIHHEFTGHVHIDFRELDQLHLQCKCHRLPN